MRKNTKPDSPKAIAKVANPAELAEQSINAALQTLADALSNEPTPPVIASIQVAIKTWLKRLEDAEVISKGLLIDYLRQNGTKSTDKGSLTSEVGGFRVTARPHKTGLDSKKVEALLRAKELSVDTYMDKDIKYLVNQTRLDAAVAAEELTAEELKTCEVKLSYALQPIERVTK